MRLLSSLLQSLELERLILRDYNLKVKPFELKLKVRTFPNLVIFITKAPITVHLSLEIKLLSDYGCIYLNSGR
jgi:hypothetical protein